MSLLDPGSARLRRLAGMTPAWVLLQLSRFRLAASAPLPI
jgi:hypothetical protein